MSMRGNAEPLLASLPRPPPGTSHLCPAQAAVPAGVWQVWNTAAELHCPYLSCGYPSGKALGLQGIQMIVFTMHFAVPPLILSSLCDPSAK